MSRLRLLSPGSLPPSGPTAQPDLAPSPVGTIVSCARCGQTLPIVVAWLLSVFMRPTASPLLHLHAPSRSSSHLTLVRPKTQVSTPQWKTRTELQTPKLWSEDRAFQEVFETEVVIKQETVSYWHPVPKPGLPRLQVSDMISVIREASAGRGTKKYLGRDRDNEEIVKKYCSFFHL